MLLKQDMSSVSGQPQGRLSVGVVPSAEPIAARFAAMLHARHPGITPVARSMISQEIETGLEELTLDVGLGFIERVRPGAASLRTLAQYTEHYLLVRQGLATTSIECGGKVPLQITMSFGLAMLDPVVSVEQSIDRADKAMYAAKTAGRNCTRAWDPSM